jgi:hypothetical protein
MVVRLDSPCVKIFHHYIHAIRRSQSETLLGVSYGSLHHCCTLVTCVIALHWSIPIPIVGHSTRDRERERDVIRPPCYRYGLFGWVVSLTLTRPTTAQQLSSAQSLSLSLPLCPAAVVSCQMSAI